MNILIDIRCLLDKPYTGVAEYTLNFLNEISKNDSADQYFLFYNSAKHYNSYFENLLSKSGWVFSNQSKAKKGNSSLQIIDFHYPNRIFNFLIWLFKWPKIDKLVEKRIGQKIDKIFLPNFNFIAFSKNKKITLVVHDLSFEIYPQFFTFKQRLWHKLIKPKKICQIADEIITHSENTKNDLVDLYQISPEKIKIKIPPITSEFKKIKENDLQLLKVKEKYQLPENFIFYLGRLEPRKNIESLISAFIKLQEKYHKNLYLLIAGHISKKFLKKINKFCKDFKDKKIRFLDYIKNEDRVYLYNLAKIFVYPSFYEGFGYPVAEALACSKIVISSHTSSLTEIESKNIVFINPYDINDLSEAIKTLLEIN